MRVRVHSGRLVRHFEDHHLELLRLLHEAADIEHSLMVQYLFAAFSVNRRYSLLAGSAVGAKGEPTTLLGIAVQEMSHLHAVNSLLVELGAAPNLTRQDLPFEPEIYPFVLSLEPLTRLSAAKYAYVEAPPELAERYPSLKSQLDEVLGKSKRLNQLGVLYEGIQDELKPVTALSEDRKRKWDLCLGAIRDNGEKDHFSFFRKVFLGEHEVFGRASSPWLLDPKDEAFPSLPLHADPTAYEHHRNMIRKPVARQLAWLGDLHYWIVLMLLDLSYRMGTIQDLMLAKRHMRCAINKLGFELAERWHVGMPFDPLNLGYAPGNDAAGTLSLLRRLVKEAECRAEEIRQHLPVGFERGLYRDTLQRIDQLRASREEDSRGDATPGVPSPRSQPT